MLNVGKLKQVIANLPDDMIVYSYCERLETDIEVYGVGLVDFESEEHAHTDEEIAEFVTRIPQGLENIGLIIFE